MELQELLKEINYLKDLIQIVDSNVKFNMQMILGVLVFIVTVIGTSLYFLAKTWFKNTIEARVKEIEKNVRKSINKEYNCAYGSGMVGYNVDKLGPSEIFNHEVYIGFRPTRVKYNITTVNSSAKGILKKGLDINHDNRVSTYNARALLEKAVIIEKAEIKNDSFILIFKNDSKEITNIKKMNIQIHWEAEYLFWEENI